MSKTILWLIHPKAGSGRALKWWQARTSHLPEQDYWIVDDKAQNFSSRVLLELQQGRRRWVCVGGDGSLHYLINALIPRLQELKISLNEISIGAVGAGSSNDFHKNPHLQKSQQHFNFTDLVDWNVLQIENQDTGQKIYSLVNASVGLTATANAFFNNPDLFLSLLKKTSVSLAILYASIKSLWSYKAVQMIEPQKVPLLNLGLVKNPCFAGDFRYPCLTEPNDGLISLFMIQGRSRLQAFKGLLNLEKNKYQNIPNADQQILKNFNWQLAEDSWLEVDGELYRGKSFSATCYPEPVRICRT
jgi:diacylglycerol kinase (ATP)